MALDRTLALEIVKKIASLYKSKIIGCFVKKVLLMSLPQRYSFVFALIFSHYSISHFSFAFLSLFLSSHSLFLLHSYLFVRSFFVLPSLVVT